MFDIQTTKASFTYQKALCYEPVAENFQYLSYFGRISNTDVENGSNREGFANAVSNIPNFRTESKGNLKKNHDEFGEILRAINFKDIKKQFDGSLSHQLKFYWSYMPLFETLLLFIRASPEQLWQLHLDSLHKFCPYFFCILYVKLRTPYTSVPCSNV